MIMEKEQLIQKWLNEELTPQEQEAFQALEEYQFYVDIVEGAKQFKASERLKVDDFEKFSQKANLKKDRTVIPLWKKPLFKIASILVVALALCFLLFYDSNVQINTLAHQKTTVELPDDSQVVLNAMSQISFSKNNWKQNRKVNLNGEAYFKVQKGNTFEVVAKDGTVTVVGTEFSVKQRDGYFEVKCYEGIVKVLSGTSAQILTAGKTYRTLDGTLSQGQTSLKEPQWLNNTSAFEAVPFTEVVNELARQYAVEVQLKNISHNPLFSGGFVHDDLNNALTAITQPLNLNYQIISSKRVVIYELKK